MEEHFFFEISSHVHVKLVVLNVGLPIYYGNGSDNNTEYILSLMDGIMQFVNLKT